MESTLSCHNRDNFRDYQSSFEALLSSSEADGGRLRRILRPLGEPAQSPAIAFLLGISISLGLYLVFYWPFSQKQEQVVPLLRAEGLYLITVSIFHLWEFVYMSKFHKEECSVDSFLVNHSTAFVLANILAQVEYFVELLIFGRSLKARPLLLLIGAVLTIVGQVIRIGSMYQAGEHFHHLIQHQQHEKHQLLTTGFYSLMRHPSYFGWFLWAAATQLLLANPIMLVLYLVACWNFFHDRILYEERLLIEQYGKLYVDYMTKVPTRIPTIPGLSSAQALQILSRSRSSS